MITTIKGHRWITFKNGYTLSIANGFGSYSENQFDYKVRDKLIVKTKYCEIAILKDGSFRTSKVLGINEKLLVYDDVKGWVNKKELKEIIKKVKNYKE